MKSTTARRITLSVAVVTALTGAAACGSGGSSSGPGEGGGAAGPGTTHVSPVAALRSADTSTAEAASAKVSMTTRVGTLMSMRSSGTLDWSHGLTGTLTLTYTGGEAAETMRGLGSTTMEARYLPDAYYAHMSDVFARQTGGKHWIRYGYENVEQFGDGRAYMKEQLQNATPNQSVKLLLASGDVRKVGEATVRGERTTHYAGTVDLADFAEKSSNLSKSQLDELREKLTRAGVTTQSVDIWINDRNLLVKKVEKTEVAVGTMTNTTYYRDYGAKVSVQAPPAGDTVEFKDLMKDLTTSRGAVTGGTGIGS